MVAVSLKKKKNEKKLKNIVSSIVSKTRTLNSIEKLKHKQNPFPKNIKIEKITEIINNLLEKNTKLELNKDEKNKLINDIYTKDLLYILRKTDSELKVGKNEIVFNQDDIQKNKLTNLNEKLLNPFKSEKTSVVYGSRVLNKKRYMQNQKIMQDDKEITLVPDELGKFFTEEDYRFSVIQVDENDPTSLRWSWESIIN